MAPETTAHDEAQRTLERKALRNVRTLIDKLEDEQRASSRTTWRYVAASIVVALVAAAVMYFAMTSSVKREAPVVSPR